MTQLAGVFAQLDRGPAGGVLPDAPVTAARSSGTGDDAVVAVSFGERTIELPVEWLRDNCRCAVCRIVQTDERRIRPWTLPPAEVEALAVDAGTLRVTWKDGHTSEYADDFWGATTRATRRGAYTANLWRSGYELGRFDHDDAVKDLAVRQELFEAFQRDGAVVVTGAPKIPGTVIEFMRRLRVTLVDSSLGFLFDVMLDPAGFNVAYTNEALSLHNDNAQYTEPPSGQVLSMVVNEASGGESILADGWCILEQLQATDPEAIDVLASVPMGFRQYSDDADGFTRARETASVGRLHAPALLEPAHAAAALRPAPLGRVVPRLPQARLAHRRRGEPRVVPVERRRDDHGERLPRAARPQGLHARRPAAPAGRVLQHRRRLRQPRPHEGRSRERDGARLTGRGRHARWCRAPRRAARTRRRPSTFG
jgi:hypothetical protein